MLAPIRETKVEFTQPDEKTFKWVSILICLSLLCTLSLISACTHNEKYRTNSELCTSKGEEAIIGKCAENSLQEFIGEQADQGSYMLGFIEFDDQGQIHDYRQVVAVRDFIQGITDQEDAIVLVFVHGWKHNAHADSKSNEEDDNITSFRRVLRSVSRNEVLRNSDAPRKVIGVYLGWRGLSVTLPGIKELSFWERKNTAHKVGTGAISEVLLTLENLITSRNRQRGSQYPEESQSRFIVIGHSFGGAAVYSAVGQILLERYMSANCIEKNNCSVRGFGDLIVLMNPAFEAIRYSTLRNATDRAEGYAGSQLPVLAILTSEKDYATKYAFPLGRTFSTLFEKERKEKDQKSKNRIAIGHYKPYQTHRLDPLQQDRKNSKTALLENKLDDFLQFSKNWEDREQTKIIFPDIGVRFTKTGSTDRFNPYLLIHVSGDLIPDHNDIYDPRIEEFIGQLIMLSIQGDDIEIREKKRNKLEDSIKKLKTK